MTPYILEFCENVEPKNANDIIFHVKKYSFCKNRYFGKFESVRRNYQWFRSQLKFSKKHLPYLLYIRICWLKCDNLWCHSFSSKMTTHRNNVWMFYSLDHAHFKYTGATEDWFQTFIYIQIIYFLQRSYLNRWFSCLPDIMIALVIQAKQLHLSYCHRKVL